MTTWSAIGWLGNVCFFSRFAVQWVHLERARTSTAPRLFWHLSLAGSVLLGAYALQRDVPILLVGFAANSVIYVRNLRFGRGRVTALSPAVAAAVGVVALVALVLAGVASRTFSPETAIGWLVCAVVGQAIWSCRFVVQWWYSERKRVSHFPAVFWIYSLVGNGLLLAYAFHLGDPVFIAGLLPGPLIQIRNLVATRHQPEGGAQA